MGVKGFDLLEIAKNRGIPSLMLTAHDLSEESLKKSAENGASYYVPKNEMDKIATFVADVLEQKRRRKTRGSGASTGSGIPLVRYLQALAGESGKKNSGTICLRTSNSSSIPRPMS